MESLVSEWLEGLASHGSVFLDLIPNGKRPIRSWKLFEDMHSRNGGSCLTQAHQWLTEGKGLGFLPRGTLWVLDVDAPNKVERILCTLREYEVSPPWVRTPSGGAHLYFCFPTEFTRIGLKHHVCHPLDEDGCKLPMDFKLGPRTLIVAPGTQNEGKHYWPATPWTDPPILDPRFFLPLGAFWNSPKRPFAICERPFESRIARACAYLQSAKTPVSVSHSGGHKTLSSVCAHLVAFLQLDPALAFYLLTHGPNPWNLRCRAQDGSPYPWSADELWKA